MRFGNISNELAYVIGIRFEHVLYNFGKVNQPGRAYLEKLLSEDINLYIVSLLAENKVKSWCYKWGILYTTVLGADSVLEIPELVQAHKMILYVDTDDHLLAEIRMRTHPQTETLKWEQPLDGP